MAASPLKSILTELHGRRAGLGALGELLLNKPNGDQEGCTRVVTIINTDLRAMFTTPQTIIPAPASGYGIVVRRVMVKKQAGTAYAGIAAGEDLAVTYTDGSGEEVTGRIETTGFLDQTTAQVRIVYPKAASGAVADITPVSAAAVVMSLLTGDITTGTGSLIVKSWYDIVNLTSLS